MQQIIIDVADPDDYLAGFGAGALIRVERDTSASFGTTTEVTVIDIVSGQTQYEYWDATGASTHYYRVRYSKASPSVSTDYSDFSAVFQVGSGPLEYVTEALLKEQVSITDAVDDTLLSVICDRVNQYVESYTKQPIGPIASATYTYDGDNLTRIFAAQPTDARTNGIGGLRAVSLLEIAPQTGAAYETIPSTDYFLRGRHGVSGPYRWLCLSDHPVTSTHRTFPKGRATVRVTATAGWVAIPDDLTETAINIARNEWNARQMGATEVIDQDGQPFVPRYVSGRDRETLRRYMLRPVP